MFRLLTAFLFVASSFCLAADITAPAQNLPDLTQRQTIHLNKSDKNDDKDGDMIPNIQEDINWNGIYDAGDLYDWQVLNTPTEGRPAAIIDDFEDWNCQRHTNTKGDHTRDWSAPGYQHMGLNDYND